MIKESIRYHDYKDKIITSTRIDQLKKYGVELPIFGIRLPPEMKDFVNMRHIIFADENKMNVICTPPNGVSFIRAIFKNDKLRMNKKTLKKKKSKF